MYFELSPELITLQMLITHWLDSVFAYLIVLFAFKTRSHTHKQLIIQRYPITQAQMSVSHFDFHLYVIIITGAWIQSGLECIHRCTGHHTLSPRLFLHACLRNRGRVPASLWVTVLLTRHLAARAVRRSVINVTHQNSTEDEMGFGWRHLLRSQFYL